MSYGSLLWVDAARGHDFGDAVVAETESPLVSGFSGWFDQGVVLVTQECQVRHVGVSAGPPGVDVVGVAEVGWFVAAGERAALVS